MHAACWCSPHKVCSLKYVHRSQQTEEHRKMLPSVVSCLLSHNYMRWKRIWPSHKSRIWPSHKSQCTLTYPCEVQCSFPQLVLRRWGTGSQQWSTQEPHPPFKEYTWGCGGLIRCEGTPLWYSSRKAKMRHRHESWMSLIVVSWCHTASLFEQQWPYAVEIHVS